MSYKDTQPTDELRLKSYFAHDDDLEGFAPLDFSSQQKIRFSRRAQTEVIS